MGTGKVFLNLFFCLIAYIPTFRKFWGLGNKLMVRKQNKTRAQASSMMWFRSPCVNKCCVSWELTFCRKNASFEREKLYSAWLDFLFVVFSYDVRDGFEKAHLLWLHPVVIKFFFQKYISRYFFPFFKLFFIVAVASCLRCCALTMALGTDCIID